MLTVEFTHPYEPRPTRHLGLWQEGGWSFNVYSIHHPDREPPDPRVIECAKHLTRRRILRRRPRFASHSLGFIIIHQAIGNDYILLCWWIDTNMICQHLFYSEANEARYRDFPVTSAAICVFEFEVMALERALWIEHVLASGGMADGYIHANRGLLLAEPD